jgi:hypothetical protein
MALQPFHRYARGARLYLSFLSDHLVGILVGAADGEFVITLPQAPTRFNQSCCFVICLAPITRNAAALGPPPGLGVAFRLAINQPDGGTRLRLRLRTACRIDCVE